MDSFRSRNSFLLIIISLCSFILLAKASPLDPLWLCKKASNPGFCTQSLKAHIPGMKGGLAPMKVLELMVDATQVQAKKTLGIIDGLLEKKGNSKSLSSSLKGCKSLYSSMMDSIKQTKEVLAKNELEEARSKFSAVISFQQTCLDQFEGMDFPFAGDSDAVYQNAGLCLDIIVEIEEANPKPLPPLVKSPPSPFDNVIGTVS